MRKFIICSIYAIILALAVALLILVLNSPMSRGNYIDQAFVAFMFIICLISTIAAFIALINTATDRWFDY